MKISLSEEVLEKYPEIEIGYLIAKLEVHKTDPIVEELKRGLSRSLEEKGINATNFVAHPSIARWRKIYEEDFHVKAKTYRSSLEALIKRVVTGKEIWNICTVVDLYNCCSVLSLLPMGGYDLDKIVGEIKIRYAQEGETFRGLGQREEIEIKKNHLVYTDDQRVICWLWNHKDAAETCIDENTKSVLFFIDSVDGKVEEALELLKEHLKTINGTTIATGRLNKDSLCSHF